MKTEAVQSHVVSQVLQLHLTGGLRATMRDGGWSLAPLVTEGRISASQPLSLDQLRSIVERLELRVLGGDNVILPNDPLPARMWTPINKAGKALLGPLMWGSISSAAEKANDKAFARLARHISFSAQAAGIRLRDASDQYHGQLHQAIKEGMPIGRNFSNIQAFDLYLSFHSLASEMASTRDYLATAFSRRLGLQKVDSLAKLAQLKGLEDRIDVQEHPVLSVMLGASDQASTDPWLYHLAKHRNKFLHREPLIGSSDGAKLQLKERQVDSYHAQVIDLIMAEGGDALSTFSDIYQHLLSLLEMAATCSEHSSEPEQVTVLG